MSQITVAKYLQHRLEELELGHVLGVAGYCTAPFLDTRVEDPNAKIKIIGKAHEINVAHCADGYARLNGISAVGKL